MDELFRLTVVRAANGTDVLTISLSPSALQEELIHTNSWNARVELAKSYLNGNFFAHVPPLIRLTDLDLYSQLIVFRDALNANPQTTGGEVLKRLTATLLDPPDLNNIDPTYLRLSDNFLALYIAPSRDRPSLLKIADFLQITWFLRLIRDGDASLYTEGIIDKVLTATITMPPPSVFGVQGKRVFPVGVTDLLLVKQHIKGYELGEIARIENILKGESRSHTKKHSLVNERSTIIDTTTETVKEQELTTNDTTNLRSEVQNTLNEELKLSAGVSLAYDGKPIHIESNVNFAYDRSKSEASKTAQELSKNVVQKSASKLTERIREVITTKITDTLEDLEDQKFDNIKGANHISGVYQWVEKVYTAQVFNYGKRLLFDLMVPEPGAYLLQLEKLPSPNAQTPIQPLPLTLHGWLPKEIPFGQTDPPLEPFDLIDDHYERPNFYGHIVARYNVPDIKPPPPLYITVSKAMTGREQDTQNISLSDTPKVDDGYLASVTNVSVSWFHRPGEGLPSQLDVLVGNTIFNFTEGAPNIQPGSARNEYYGTQGNLLQNQQESIAVSVRTAYISEIAVNIEITCTRTEALYAKWQIETYGKIAAYYKTLQDDYDNAQKARQYAQQVGPLSRDTEINRLTERTELKRSCIAILRNEQMGGFDDIDPALTVPSPNLNTSQDNGAIVRFFEQAFEWDKIGYVCYPYFWGRQTQWNTTASLVNGDPLFESFLRAGYARVVIPVRPSFNDAIAYFLTTNQIWQGGSLPAVIDPTYLPIAEEIKEQTGAPGDEQPQGDPWEFRLPTDLIKLRQDDLLPSWTWDGHRNPTPGNWHWTGNDLKLNAQKKG